MSLSLWPNRLEALRAGLLRAAERQIRNDLRPRVDASDVVQQTLIEAAQALGGRQQMSDDELAVWLRHALRNNARDAVRRANAKKRDVGRELRFRRTIRWHGIRCRERQPDSVATLHEVDNALDAAIAELPLTYQRVVLLRHRDRLSFSQIADQLAVSENAAQKLWTRALEMLRGRLRKFA
jgi:RNA polymerase sigma-70 factor, ECF subfamily